MIHSPEELIADTVLSDIEELIEQLERCTQMLAHLAEMAVFDGIVLNDQYL